MIELSTKQTEVWRALDDPSVLEVFAGGGAGGGKSVLGCVRQIYRRTKYPGTRGFIGRENFTALRDSTMKTYFDMVTQWGYRQGDHYHYNAQEHTLTWMNGTDRHPNSEQHFRHMAYQPSDPDYNRFGSTEYTDAFVDEAPEVRKRACQVLLSRLRYRHAEHGITPELLLTGNPGLHWVKDEFVMDGRGEFIALPPHRSRVLFTIEDNPDPEIRRRYSETLDHLDEYDKRRLKYGDWTVMPNVERPFTFAFNPSVHRAVTTRRPNDIVYFSIDFNVDPFVAIAAHIWKDHEGWHFHRIAESNLKTASIEAMADWMRTICPRVMMMRVTGDRNGMSRIIGDRGPIRLFTQLAQKLGASFEGQFKIPPNPTHLVSREEVNLVFTPRAGMDNRIDPSCTNLLSDHSNVQVDMEGRIIKGDRTKKDQRSDHVDCDRYIINTYLRDYIKEVQHGMQRR